MTVHNLKDRMGRLEGRLIPSPATQRQLEDDAAAFTKRMLDVTSQMTDEDAKIPRDARIKMSPATHFAWAIRFAPGEANVAQIMTAHSRQFEPCA